MEVALAIAAVIIGAIVVWLAFGFFQGLRQGKRMSWDFERYLGLRRQYMADPSLTSDRAFGDAADAIVARIGPRFDPRLSSWSRLESAEPRLLAYVTQYIDPSVEEPLDLEAFADSILLITLSTPGMIGPGQWQKAMESCLRLAAEWRLAQPGRYGDAVSPTLDIATEEAVAVTARFFRSGDWRWDFEEGKAVDQPALAFGAALAPEIGPKSPSGSPGPVDGRDIARQLASGQGTMLTPSKGAASADGAALAPEIGSNWRWTASGPTPSPSSRQLPSASRLAGDGVFQTRADPTLQLDAFAQLLQGFALAGLGSEMGTLSEQRPMPRCEDAHVASIVPMDASAWPEEALPADLVVAGTWFEQWTLGCEDTRWPYAVAFMPDLKGGTAISSKLIE